LVIHYCRTIDTLDPRSGGEQGPPSKYNIVTYTGSVTEDAWIETFFAYPITYRTNILNDNFDSGMVVVLYNGITGVDNTNDEWYYTTTTVEKGRIIIDLSVYTTSIPELIEAGKVSYKVVVMFFDE
jgi:hypothetical protein